MTLAATYNPDISRVQLVFSGYNALADYAKVERLDPNGVTWSVIRGGDQVTLTSGAGAVDDFEFVPNTVNTYRVSAVDSAAPSFITASGAFTGNNTSLATAFPGTPSAGDVSLIFASIRNSGAGVPNTPAGWTVLLDMSNAKIFGRVFVTGDTAPTITFTGGVAGADTIAHVARFRNINLIPVSTANQLNGSAQNIPLNGFTASPGLTVAAFWKASTTTGVALFPGMTADFGDIPSALGSGAMIAWQYLSNPTASATVLTNSLTTAGGSAQISRSGFLTFSALPFTNQESTTITPTFAFDEYWLKNPSRPGLNIKVTVTEIGDITRPARTGTFPVLGRTVPVAVTDVQGSRQFSLEIFTDGEANGTDMDNRLSTGEPMLLQGGGPTDIVPTVYFVAGDVVTGRPAKGHTAHTFTIPVTEVARPGNTVYGLTEVWQDVINTYADWNAVLSATPDWSSLINKVSTSIVIVS